MVSSDAPTVDQYLTELPENRRPAIEAVLELVRKNLPEGYEEEMNWGMISWQVPLEVEPDTYNGKPLLFASLASQKRHMALYMMSVYQDESKRGRLLAAYEEMGRKPNMGASCIRFTRLEHLPLDIIGELIAASPMDEFIEAARR